MPGPATPENYSVSIWNEHNGAQPSHNLAPGRRKNKNPLRFIKKLFQNLLKNYFL